MHTSGYTLICSKYMPAGLPTYMGACMRTHSYDSASHLLLTSGSLEKVLMKEGWEVKGDGDGNWKLAISKALRGYFGALWGLSAGWTGV